MFTIVNKIGLAPGIKQFTINAPDIAKKAQPGEFVILRANENSARIHLNIVDFDRNEGTIILVLEESGNPTIHLDSLEPGDKILDLAGPLGNGSDIAKFGKVICIASGVQIASVYPITRALKEIGNEVVSIIGADTKEHIIFHQEMKEVSDEIHIFTEDGSEGQKGLARDLLKQTLEKDAKFDLVMAIGSIAMMRDVCEITRSYNIPTRVNMHVPILDGVGLCGTCRVSVGGKIKFACVDGPEFDGHLVDWDIAEQRMNAFKAEEHISGGGCKCQK